MTALALVKGRQQTLSGVAPPTTPHLTADDIESIKSARRSLATWHVAFSLIRKSVLRAMYVLDMVDTCPLVLVESIDEQAYLDSLKAVDYVRGRCD
jgi:hypothetical protein